MDSMERYLSKKRHRNDGNGFYSIRERLDAGKYSHRFFQPDLDQDQASCGLILGVDVGFYGICGDTPVQMIDKSLYMHPQILELPEIVNVWPRPNRNLPFIWRY